MKEAEPIHNCLLCWRYMEYVECFVRRRLTFKTHRDVTLTWQGSLKGLYIHTFKNVTTVTWCSRQSQSSFLSSGNKERCASAPPPPIFPTSHTAHTLHTMTDQASWKSMRDLSFFILHTMTSITCVQTKCHTWLLSMRDCEEVCSIIPQLSGYCASPLSFVFRRGQTTLWKSSFKALFCLTT